MAEKYRRTRGELEIEAEKWWPEFLQKEEREASIIPKLIATQDRFISLLTLVEPTDFDKLCKLIKDSEFPANLFLKHLVVLADFGGEPIQRINRDFDQYFKDKKIEVCLNKKVFSHHFTHLPTSSTLNNKKMKIDGVGISEEYVLDDFFEDIIFILMYGAFNTNDDVAEILQNCNIGGMLGDKDQLSEFIKQRYIHVSRITGGAKASNLGNIAQKHVANYLSSRLGPEYTVISNGHIPGITQNDGKTEMSFDVVVEHKTRYVAIEVSFQVTTNSTIERKAGQASDRHQKISKSGNYIAYIIDGAGNFQRASALDTICNNSDCTVAYTHEEFDLLIKFIEMVL